MTKWYDRIGNTIQMNINNQWIKGKVVYGYRTHDGVVNMETEDGKKCWCGSSGEGVHFRKCDDSDGDLITNADRIRQMTDEELAEFLVNFKNTFGEEYEGVMSCLEWLREELEEKDE